MVITQYRGTIGEMSGYGLFILRNNLIVARMRFSSMTLGIIQTTHSRRQLDRVNIDPRRSAVSFGNKNDVQSVLGFTAIKIDRGQLLFLFNVLLAINFGVSWKRHRANGELDRAIGSHMVDCLLSAWRVHVKVSACQTGMVVACS